MTTIFPKITLLCLLWRHKSHIREWMSNTPLKKTQNSADPDFQTLSHIHPDPYHRGVCLKVVGNRFLRTSIHLLCIKSILRSMFACIFIWNCSEYNNIYIFSAKHSNFKPRCGCSTIFQRGYGGCQVVQSHQKHAQSTYLDEYLWFYKNLTEKFLLDIFKQHFEFPFFL